MKKIALTLKLYKRKRWPPIILKIHNSRLKTVEWTSTQEVPPIWTWKTIRNTRAWWRWFWLPELKCTQLSLRDSNLQPSGLRVWHGTYSIIPQKLDQWSSTYALQIFPSTKIRTICWNWEKCPQRHPWMHESRQKKRTDTGQFYFSFQKFHSTTFKRKFWCEGVLEKDLELHLF